MGGLYRRADRRRPRWRRRIKGRRGVVSVVGTLLSLLVFFALFGVFITQYVPLWMNDNESVFTAQTQEAMATLKSNFDIQAALGSPGVLATGFTMTSEGIPLIAQPTGGVLTFVPNTLGVFANVSMTVGPGHSGPFFQNLSLGTLSMTLPNRYYPGQQFQFEDDAVVQSQGDTHQLLLFSPIFSTNQSGSTISVTASLFQLYGNATQVVSIGTQDVYSHLLFNTTYVSNVASGSSFSATIKLGTHYPCAWSTFFQQGLVNSNIAKSHYTLTPSTCVASKGTAVPVSVVFTGVSSFTLIVAGFQIATGVGTG